ncbi:hypothetical protein MBLNU457_g0775t1 [Dothideomycetes sp. NU457]
MAAAMDLSEWDNDPRLFLFTSLTAGSSHIVTATSRLETILKANKLPFQAIDVATDEKARRLWGRRAGKKKLPGLVKEGYVIGDLEEVEEWNEYGELKENVGPVPANNSTSVPPAAAQSTTTTTSSQLDGTASDPMRDAAAQAASVGLARQGKPTVLVDQSKFRPLNAPVDTPPATSTSTSTDKTSSAPAAESSSITAPPKAETMTSAPDDKAASIETAAAESGSKDETVSTTGDTTDTGASTKPAESAQKTELPFRTKPTSTTAAATPKDQPEASAAGEEATKPVEDEVDTKHGREEQTENKTESKTNGTTGDEEQRIQIKGLEDDKDTIATATSVEGTESSKVEEKGQPKEADEAGVSVED